MALSRRVSILSSLCTVRSPLSQVKAVNSFASNANTSWLNYRRASSGSKFGANSVEMLQNPLESPHGCQLLSSEPEKMLQQLGFLFVQDQTGVRLDLLLAETSFDAEAMVRGREIEPTPQFRITVCSPEDLIIYKMISTRPRDHEDVKGIIGRQGAGLDNRYIENWLQEFEQALDDSTLVEAYRRMREAGR